MDPTQQNTDAVSSPDQDSADQSETSPPMDWDQFKIFFMQCPVCRDTCHLGQRPPKMLPCNHTVCLPCLTQVFEHSPRVFGISSSDIHKKVRCPTCRGEMCLTKDDLIRMPNDRHMLQILEFFSQAPAMSSDTGSTPNDREPLTINETGANNTETGNQTIRGMLRTLSNIPTLCEDTEQEHTHIIQRMKGRAQSLLNANINLSDLKPSLLSKIESTFSEYHDMLRQRQDMLCKLVTQFIADQKTRIHNRLDQVLDFRVGLEEQMLELKSSRCANDPQKSLMVIQTMKEWLSSNLQMAFEDDTELFQTCEFVAQNEGIFYTDMTELGEIQAKPDHTLSSRPVTGGSASLPDTEQCLDGWFDVGDNAEFQYFDLAEMMNSLSQTPHEMCLASQRVLKQISEKAARTVGIVNKLPALKTNTLETKMIQCLPLSCSLDLVSDSFKRFCAPLHRQKKA